MCSANAHSSASKYTIRKNVRDNSTTLVGVINSSNGKIAYSKEMEKLADWYRDNSLPLNVVPIIFVSYSLLSMYFIVFIKANWFIGI